MLSSKTKQLNLLSADWLQHDKMNTSWIVVQKEMRGNTNRG
nr:MAG TPA: hypothetical protein [Caudoviricetes sp.]